MDSHECPVLRCPQRIGGQLLMCRPHWHLVPKTLQNAVYTAWDKGAGAGTAAHSAAILAAVRAVNAKLEARRDQG